VKVLTYNLCSNNATNITTSSSNPSFPSSNLKHPFRSKRWRATGCTAENVVFDMVTTEPVDSVVILWPKEDELKLTSSYVIRVQANATNTWTSPAVDQILTIDENYSVASHFFGTDQEYRYWRITIEDVTNPWGYVELGVVWIGKSLAVTNAENGFKWQLTDRSKSVVTEFGHKYTDEYPSSSSLNINYKYLDYEEIQIIENAFRLNGSKHPILVAVDPEEVVFNRNHFLIYGTMSNTLSLNHVRYNILDIPDITIEELS
jgi:hypothetical protein